LPGQVLLVVLSGDRGLCGGYNNFIIKKARAQRSARAPRRPAR
jgi:F0F1-type ATP synthase gamma subunit